MKQKRIPEHSRAPGAVRDTKKKVMTDSDKAFYQGFALAVGFVIRDHHDDSMGLDAMRCNGINYETLKAAGVDPFDLDQIKKAMRG